MVLNNMKQKIELSAHGHQAWTRLCKDFSLTPEAIAGVQTYMHALHEWNQKTNLTRITDWYEVIEYHIRDSLIFGKMVDCSKELLICDVGTGGGLPGIPLKIVYPHLNIILIEVVERKVEFLNHVIQLLELKNIDVCTLDWRTFLRSTEAPINYFVARASLRPDELLRAYKPSSAYHKANVVYWAIDAWQPTIKEEKNVSREYSYVVGEKPRKLIQFSYK